MGFSILSLGFFYDQLIRRLPYPSTNLSGRTYIVTGANTGLGLEAARHCVRLGAEKVIIAVRDVSRGTKAQEDIERTTHRKGVIQISRLDLASYASVEAFALEMQKLDRIDGVIMNAGIAPQTFALAEENEASITVNVVSTLLLTVLMLPRLREVGRAHDIHPHIAIVSSEVHAWAELAPDFAPEGEIFNKLSDKEAADMSQRYPLSKLLEILLVRELMNDIRGKGEQDNVIINTVNPGFCLTTLDRDIKPSAVVNFLKSILARTSEMGSRTEFHAAVCTSLNDQGHYLSNCMHGETSEYVQGSSGKEVGRRLYKELLAKFEVIAPGVTANIKA